jgi:3-hydroxybutyrate dehydrogenase
MNIAIKSESIFARKSLTGRVSLVTGSTSGIGLGIARALAAAGSDIVLNGFGKPDMIAEAQSQIAALSVRVFHSAADMSSPEAIREMIDTTLASFGRLDILVNNAGIQHVAALQDFPAEKWDAILAINLSSAFHTSRLALPSMLKNKWGRIINMASAHGLVGSPFKSAYVAAKHGIVGLTKVVALETAELGITCNAICPGYVYTPLVEAQIDGQAKAHGIPREQVIRDVLLAQQPNKRFASVDELGARGVSRQRCSSIDHRCSIARRWRLDRALTDSALRGALSSRYLHAQPTFPGSLPCHSSQSRTLSTNSEERRTARWSSSFRAAARSVPIKSAYIRRCMRPASSRTGSSEPRSARSTPASSPATSLKIA